MCGAWHAISFQFFLEVKTDNLLVLYQIDSYFQLEINFPLQVNSEYAKPTKQHLLLVLVTLPPDKLPLITQNPL